MVDVGRCRVAHLSGRPAAQPDEGHDADDDVRGEVGEPDLGFMARQPRAGHRAVGDHAHRGERREVAGVGAVGDHQRHQQRRHAHADTHRHRQRRHQRDRGNGARADRRQRAGQHEDQHGHHPSIAAGEPDGQVRQGSERAVGLGDRKQQRHPDEREKQRHREARQDDVGSQARGVDADEPGKRHREPSHVDAGRHRHARGRRRARATTGRLGSRGLGGT